MLLTARRIFTGASTEVLRDHVVEVADGRIVDIRPRDDRSPDEAIDLGDATLLPGLVDVHQHLAFDASLDPVAHLDADDDATLVLRMRLAAQRALAVGITTIRDLGDRDYLSLTLRDWFGAATRSGPASSPRDRRSRRSAATAGSSAARPPESKVCEPRCGTGSPTAST